MTFADWTVLALYMVGMLAIGVYYSRGTTSTEEYLLGGRQMPSFWVGLSLFAALLSTISYLAIPGEMIKHGPMAMLGVMASPFAFLIVGWFLIPWIMRSNVTTAYEILESRLGLSVRLLGSSLFLASRLAWMGFIIYATTSQVLVPLLKLPASSTPWICLIMGVVTVVYTSMGGLRAVVVTDAVQSIVLLGGAILTIVVVSVSLGGVTGWWPKSSPQHWANWEWGIQSGSRISLLSVLLHDFLWWICTSSSDQMAVQRYLATRDEKAARRSLAVSMITMAIVVGLLLLVGLALLAYFQRFPVELGNGLNIEDADRLFTRFIVIGFPSGVTGLVIAGLLAASMSSLSAGVNSACSVVAIDFFDRLGRPAANEAQHVRRTKAICWSIGLVTVALSIVVGATPGNLLEASSKVVDLLVGPLFILFFMALFIPWSTPLGTWVATIASIVVAVGMAYFNWFDVSFMLILPVSLLVGVVVGPLFSALEKAVARPVSRNS